MMHRALLLCLAFNIGVLEGFFVHHRGLPATSSSKHCTLRMVNGDAGEAPHPRKFDKKWMKKRKRVELGPDGLPIKPIHAPRQQRG